LHMLPVGVAAPQPHTSNMLIHAHELIPLAARHFSPLGFATHVYGFTSSISIPEAVATTRLLNMTAGGSSLHHDS